MRFSFWIGNGHPTDEILDRGRWAESVGYDGLWIADHFMPSTGDGAGPMHEAWAILSALAAVTERARLGPLVCGNTYRHPAVLAKQAVTADHISGGRIVLGIGAGWQENEHVAYGLEYGTFSDRFERLEEALQVLRCLRRDPRTTFDGDRYNLVEAPLEPKPVGPLPILIGGGGERKTLRLVARHADEWNVWSDPEIMAQKSAVLDKHCEDEGRDPAEIQRSAVALLFLCDTDDQAAERRSRDIGRPALIGTPAQLHEQLAAFADIGVDEVIVPDFNLGPSARDVGERFITEVAAPFRS
ncbi:MAG: LLM class F420-dependent oxidoreductase [Acidimicrobiales bacterium]